MWPEESKEDYTCETALQNPAICVHSTLKTEDTLLIAKSVTTIASSSGSVTSPILIKLHPIRCKHYNAT